jgi:hypothetical protein
VAQSEASLGIWEQAYSLAGDQYKFEVVLTETSSFWIKRQDWWMVNGGHLESFDSHVWADIRCLLYTRLCTFVLRHFFLRLDVVLPGSCLNSVPFKRWIFALIL